MANDPEMETVARDATDARPARRRVHPVVWLLLAVVALDVLAFLVAPPFPKGGAPGDALRLPGLLHQRQPGVPAAPRRLGPDPANPHAHRLAGDRVPPEHHLDPPHDVDRRARAAARRVRRHAPAARRPRAAPELRGVGLRVARRLRRSTGGPAAARHVPIFASFFILILFCNWSGLVPPVGKVEELRAPTSDVNVTIGLALVAFVYFEVQGFRALGVGYLGKFFPLREFRNGIGAGLIAMFVGLDRADARAREARHAEHAVVRQHLRRGGRARRRHRAHRSPSSRS